MIGVALSPGAACGGRPVDAPVGMFDPSHLFETAALGLWFDPSDRSTLSRWDGTPVTADGQEVARIADKSGQGRDAVQSTAITACPIYRTDGALHWLDFDGVDDELIVSGIDMGAAQQFSVSLGLSDMAQKRGYLFLLGASFGTGGAAGLGRSYYVGDDYAVIQRGSSAYNIQNYVGFAAPRQDVVSVAFDLSGGDLAARQDLRVNGAAAANLGGIASESSPALSFATGDMTIGGMPTATLNTAFGLYGFIARQGRWEAGEMSGLESFLAARSGVSV